MKERILEKAVEVLRAEADGIMKLAGRIDAPFVRMVEMILAARGRLILSGIGKSGLIAKKIVATLNSTGTRAIFLHPVEAMHGDLGMVSPDDIFIGLSNSGETEELNAVIASIREIGCPVVAFTGNAESTLARCSDLVIDVGVEREACSVGAPTTSTAAQMAMGDALAVVLMDQKRFDTTDFKRFHPGGTLGRRLSSRVRDLMLTGDTLPRAGQDAGMEEALRVINRFGLGAALIVDPEEILIGIITDGDIRRTIARKAPIFELSVRDVMTPNPRSAGPDTPAYDALNIMERHQITVLPIIEEDGRIAGILHLHDILGKGAFTFNGKTNA